MTDTTNGDAAATQSASIYSLPAELLDMILNLRPELAYTCKYLYDLNLKNELATVRGPGCKIAGVRNFTFKENPVRLISSFNSRLRRMRSHPGADYVRKLYVSMNNSKSGKMGSYISSIAHHLCAFKNLYQVNIIMSSLYHILAITNIRMENVTTLVLECRSISLEQHEPSNMVDLLLTSVPNIEKLLIYGGNDSLFSVDKLRRELSQRMTKFSRLQYAVVVYRRWTNAYMTSTLLYLHEYKRGVGDDFAHTHTVLAPLPGFNKESATIRRVLDTMALSNNETLLHQITFGYE